MLEPSRRHGHYDHRGPAWSPRRISSTPVGAGDKMGHGVAAGLSFDVFSGIFPAGKTRHYLPVICAWSRYREGGSS
jgi:hypothetical protein